jgi:nitronate monooxygenase
VRPMPAAQLVALLAQEWQQATAPRGNSTIGHQ